MHLSNRTLFSRAQHFARRYAREREPLVVKTESPLCRRGTTVSASKRERERYKNAFFFAPLVPHHRVGRSVVFKAVVVVLFEVILGREDDAATDPMGNERREKCIFVPLSLTF